MKSCKAETQLTGTKEWAKHNVNSIRGCRHNCWYCYAKQMALRFRRIEKPEQWAQMEFVGAKNIPSNSTVMYPSTHDIFPEWICEQICDLYVILKRENNLIIVSKPHLQCIWKICDWLDGDGEADTGPMNAIPPGWKSRVEFRFTIGSKYTPLLQKYEPGAPPFEERLKCVQYALERGFKTSISIEPYLEYPVHLVENLENFALDGHGVDSIWIGAMNHGAPPELRELYTRENMDLIYSDLCNFKNVRWKDSFRKAGICTSDGRAL
jgi:DNA repair photolyase